MAKNISTPDATSAPSRLVFRVLLPVSAVLVLGLGIAYTSDVPVTDLLRDPSATLNGEWYVGLVSIAGVALWAAAAAICLLASAPGRRRGNTPC